MDGGRRLQNKIPDGLHRQIYRSNLIRAPFQLLTNQGFTVNRAFIFDLMFQAGPEVQGDGPDLNFGGHSRSGSLPYFYNHVVAPVAIWLWESQIILDFYYLQLFLFFQPAGHPVNVVRKSADDAQTQSIVNLGKGIVRSWG